MLIGWPRSCIHCHTYNPNSHLQDHWTGERVIFRGDLGNEGWPCRPRTCVLRVVIPGLASVCSRGEVFIKV